MGGRAGICCAVGGMSGGGEGSERREASGGVWREVMQWRVEE